MARRAVLVAGLCLTLLGCAGGAVHSARSGGAAQLPRWRPALHLTAPVDLTVARRDGLLTVAAAGRLFLLGRGGRLSPFAQGPGGYQTAKVPEPYIVLVPEMRLPYAGCAFHRDDVYALEPAGELGVVRIDRHGHATRFASLSPGGLPNGIAFDQVGRFGHRLLITERMGDHTMVFALDCRGRARVLTTLAPLLEGGIAVAPASFGSFAGTLVAADETSGNIISIDTAGRARTVALSGLPAGPDLGVESLGFAPPGFGGLVAYVADRVSPGNPHPGDDVILALSGRVLQAAGVRPGDLLAASEGGGATVAVRCQEVCDVRQIANGPAIAHVEGHIVFARALALGPASS